MSTATIKTMVEVELSIEVASKWFANLDDDSQAQFFVEVAKAASEWNDSGYGNGYQWYAIGSHLKNCDCSTEEARELIRGIARGMENGTH